LRLLHLHEGLIGYLGDQACRNTLQENRRRQGGQLKVTNAARITDKYWASALLPDTNAQLQARLSSNLVGTVRPIRPITCSPQTIAIGAPHCQCPAVRRRQGSQRRRHQFPAGRLGGYNKQLGLNHFDLLITGRFYFITKPMFWRWTGSITWSAISASHPAGDGTGEAVVLPARQQVLCIDGEDEIGAAATRRAEGTLSRRQVKQQQEMMKSTKKERINPIAGFFRRAADSGVLLALQKLFVTIEMRHAPFYGWIKDLSAPDPTNLFNCSPASLRPNTVPLFGHYLRSAMADHHGHHMWFQMKLNPTPPDPTRR